MSSAAWEMVVRAATSAAGTGWAAALSAAVALSRWPRAASARARVPAWVRCWICRRSASTRRRDCSTRLSSGARDHPDPETYIRNRRHTGAIYVCMDLIEIVEGVEVLPAVYSSPEFAGALDAACNVVCWTNDVYSLAKERSLGEVHNLVCVMASHHGLTMEQAVRQVGAAIAAETASYRSLEQQLLRAYPRHGPAPPPASPPGPPASPPVQPRARRPGRAVPRPRPPDRPAAYVREKSGSAPVL